MGAPYVVPEYAGPPLPPPAVRHPLFSGCESACGRWLQAAYDRGLRVPSLLKFDPGFDAMRKHKEHGYVLYDMGEKMSDKRGPPDTTTYVGLFHTSLQPVWMDPDFSHYLHH